MTGQLLGIVGVGRMGRPMAGRLLDAGYKLVIHDRNEAATKPLAARGAKVVASAKAVASETEIVFVSLPTPDIVKAVALGENGVLAGAKAKTVIDLSTTGPTVAGHCAAAATERKIVWIDCPISGGVAGAAAGTLGVMVSGPRATADTIEPILKVFGKVFFVGETPGLAQTAKLCNNLLSMTAMAATAEIMAMGTKAGLDPRTLLDIINVSSGRNTATMDKFPRSILSGKFDYAFTTGLAYKDVRLCIDEGEAMGVPMVVGAAVRQMWAVTQAKHGAESDFTCVAKVLEDWSGVEIRDKKGS
jgi:3-hydroxyisobutyrate dehydrogenase-like beta-hydroxyacid dehydrogenase